MQCNNQSVMRENSELWDPAQSCFIQISSALDHQQTISGDDFHVIEDQMFILWDRVKHIEGTQLKPLKVVEYRKYPPNTLSTVSLWSNPLLQSHWYQAIIEFLCLLFTFFPQKMINPTHVTTLGAVCWIVSRKRCSLN